MYIIVHSWHSEERLQKLLLAFANERKKRKIQECFSPCLEIKHVMTKVSQVKLEQHTFQLLAIYYLLILGRLSKAIYLQCNVGDLGLIPGLERSPGERNSYPLQYSGPENSMDCIVMGSQRVGCDWVTFTFTGRPWVLNNHYQPDIIAGILSKEKEHLVKCLLDPRNQAIFLMNTFYLIH